MPDSQPRSIVSISKADAAIIIVLRFETPEFLQPLKSTKSTPLVLFYFTGLWQRASVYMAVASTATATVLVYQGRAIDESVVSHDWPASGHISRLYFKGELDGECIQLANSLQNIGGLQIISASGVTELLRGGSEPGDLVLSWPVE
jgi:hypothetical protein